MKGKIIVLEGIDGSGKSTQLKILKERLEAEGYPIRCLSFPRYSEDSSLMVRMYLDGQFGSEPSKINPYIASAFYAHDRLVAFSGELKEYYESGGCILLDRYTTSNAVHQGAKLEDDDRSKFADWLFDYEYSKLGIPAPDIVILLDMPADISVKLIALRGDKPDIHESLDFLKKSEHSARWLAKRFGWQKIFCSENGLPRQRESIFNDIYTQIKNL